MQNKEIRIYYINNNYPIETCLLSDLLTYLPDDIRTKAARFRRWQDAQACVIGNLLVNEFVLRIANLRFEDILFNPYGKPYLPIDISYNISHTDGLILLAVSELEVGVDVEFIKCFDFIAVLQMMANLDITKQVMNSSNPIIEFYKYWTKKEACIKQCGIGLSYPLNSFEITKCNTANLNGRKLRIENIDMGLADFIASLAFPDTYTNVSINLFPLRIHNKFQIFYPK